jgi:hypothetical protein
MHVPINVKSPNNISEWQMGFNSAFKGLIYTCARHEGNTGRFDQGKTAPRPVDKQAGKVSEAAWTL